MVSQSANALHDCTGTHPLLMQLARLIKAHCRQLSLPERVVCDFPGISAGNELDTEFCALWPEANIRLTGESFLRLGVLIWWAPFM